MILRDYQTKLINDLRNAISGGCRSVCAVLGCGGGKSVIAAEIARLTTARGGRVLFLVHRLELCDQISRTFTAQGVDMDLCKVGMVQTVTRRLASEEPPALIIQDEAHHCLAAGYRRIYDSFPGVPLVGFTATPCRMNEGGLGEVFNKLIESVSTSWLIEHRYLAPYRYLSLKLADTGALHTRHGDYCRKEVERLMTQRAIFGDTVKNWQLHAGYMQTIVYCAGIEASMQTAQAFRDSGIPAEHLDGTTPEQERAETVARFRAGDVKVLCNVDLFGEGFDVPDCGCVVLLRPTKSLTLHIQQSMRSMRYKPDKTAVILDHVGNYMLHGLPDDRREWTLDAKKRLRETPLLRIKTCPMCFSVIEAGAAKCPHCGYEFTPEEIDKRQKMVEDFELKEIKKSPLGDKLREMEYDDYRDLKTFNELRLFQKARGYKFGWCLRKALELGIQIPGKYDYMMYRMGLYGG